MTTWDDFTIFAAAASALWIAGSAVAMRSKELSKAAVWLTAGGLCVYAAFIVAFWVTLQRPPLCTLGETRLWYSLFMALSGLLTYRRWHYRWILLFSTIVSIVFVAINLLKPEIHDQSLMPALQSFELLYSDTRLSADGTVSCATCHGLNTAGVDNKRYSEGIDGQLGGVNAPTVYNACFNFVQFWDGRAATLAEQAGGPPLNPVEMGCKSFDEIVARLSDDKAFVKSFNEVYPEGLSQATITDAIAEFEKTLVTPNSDFDRYLKGDKNAMAAEQIEGYDLFKKYDCATCHAGVNMGGLTYELMGQHANYFEDRELTEKSGLTDGDNGRWAQTKVERDRYRFKTPTLRNVALTYPYYHDGSVETLKEAVMKMAKYQVGREMTDGEADKVVSYLNALTGEYKGKKLTNDNDK